MFEIRTGWTVDRGAPARALPLEDDHPALRDALEASGIGLFEYDPVARQVRASRQTHRLLGISDDEPIPVDHAKQLVHPDDIATLRDAWYRSRDAAGVFECEHRLRQSDGGYRWMRTRASPRRSSVDGSLRWYGTCEDIDERRRARDALQRVAATFDGLIQNNPFGIYVVDADFRLALVSRGSQKVFERVRPLLGRDFAEVLRCIWEEPFAEQAIARFRHTLATGEPFQSAATVQRRADLGMVEAYDWRIERIELPDGRPGVVCYFYDLSERLAHERELSDSEARLTLALQASRMHPWRADLLADRFHPSPGARLLHGMVPSDEPVAHEELLGCVHPLDRERVAIQLASGEFDCGGIEYRTLATDGGVRWVEAVARRVRDDDGRPTHRVIGTVRDVTEAKATQSALAAIYEVSPLLIGVVEPLDDGDVLHVYDNPAACRVLGVPPGASAGRRATELGVPRIAAELWRERYEAAGRMEAPVSFVYEHGEPGAASRWLSVSIAPLRQYGPGGRPLFCYIAEDVTERRAAEQAIARSEAQLQAANATLRHADRQKDRFLAMLSHELRNPLAPIRTVATLLGSPQLEPAQLDWARQVIQRQVRHLALLLDDLLDVARITQGKLSLRRSQVELRGVIDAAIETVQPLLEEKQHALVREIEGCDTVVDVDALRISQVLSNLLTNAAKYTEPGGRIVLRAGIAGGELRFAVEDDGAGIPREALSRIFAMFEQLDHGNGSARSGLGIGLALVKGLVELHGGRVEAASGGHGCGSTFRVVIPVEAPMHPSP